jgi:FkbM family methyltransferase
MNYSPKKNHKYFGQNGDDYFIWSLFDDCCSGYFVDVGAFDGVHLSNSYSFELEGWRGICVEAHPDFYPILFKNRPNSYNVHAACVRDPSISTAEFLSEPLGLLSGIEAHKTKNMERRYQARGMKFPGWQKVKVPAMTLTEVLKHAGAPMEISFLSVDVEGTEYDVLQGIDFSRFTFRLIVTESNSTADGNSIAKFLRGLGYIPARTIGGNTFFVRTEADRGILANLKGGVKIEDTLHPMGEQATRAGTRARTLQL